MYDKNKDIKIKFNNLGHVLYKKNILRHKTRKEKKLNVIILL
jgi:hypothetical protein